MNKVSILSETAHFLFVDKPSGITAIPDRFKQHGQSFLDQIREAVPSALPVHRIDRETSGVMVFAKNPEAHRLLNQLFAERKVHKEYLALVKGCPETDKGKIDFPLAENPARKGTWRVVKKGLDALTEWEVVERFPGVSLVRFLLHTGRTHQIRVHAAHKGFPLLADAVYGTQSEVFLSTFKKNFKVSHWEEERPILSRLSLHAFGLGFVCPITEEQLKVFSPLHKDMEALLRQLRKLN